MDRRAFLAGAVGLALAPRALAKNVPLALVTADLESKLVAVELRDGRPVIEIDTDAYPRSIENVGGTAVVAHSELGLVSLVDVFVETRVLAGFGEPRYTVADLDQRHAYVTDAKRGEVVVVDVVQGRKVAGVQVGQHARHLSLAPGGRMLWVALGSKAERVAVVDVSAPARPRLVRTFAPPFLAHDSASPPTGATRG